MRAYNMLESSKGCFNNCKRDGIATNVQETKVIQLSEAKVRDRTRLSKKAGPFRLLPVDASHGEVPHNRYFASANLPCQKNI